MNKILVKFPTRCRPQKFFNTLQGYIAMANDPKNIYFLITIDDDDITIQQSHLLEVLKRMENVSVFSGVSFDKIHAVNRDMNKAPKFDILVLGSDDMVCIAQGWDDVLRTEMIESFPDTDGVLWHNDGYLQNRLNTMCILGRKYYERFNYIYEPSYKSLWCDNEFMDVSKSLDKVKYFEQVLFRHEHPANNGQKSDEQYKKTESFYLEDQKTYQRRKALHFKNGI